MRNNNKHLKGLRNPADRLTETVCRLICLFFLIIFLLPLGYVLLSSVHSHDVWGLDGYKLLLENKLVLSGLKNSILLALLGTAYSLLLEIPAAFVLSKKEYG